MNRWTSTKRTGFRECRDLNPYSCLNLVDSVLYVLYTCMLCNVRACSSQIVRLDILNMGMFCNLQQCGLFPPRELAFPFGISVSSMFFSFFFLPPDRLEASSPCGVSSRILSSPLLPSPLLGGPQFACSKEQEITKYFGRSRVRSMRALRSQSRRVGGEV